MIYTLPQYKRIPTLCMLMVLVLMFGCTAPSGVPEPPGPTIAQIQLSPDDEPLMSMGQQVQLEAVVTTTEGETLANPALAWSTSNAAVLTVSNTGLMTGQADGTATVTAALGGQSGALSFRIVDLTGTWVGGVPPDTVRYVLDQTGTSVPGTFESLNGFPPITNVNTGVLSGSLNFERYEHTLTVITEQDCELIITGAHEVRVENSGELILEPSGSGQLTSTNCSFRGTIDFATLRRQ